MRLQSLPDHLHGVATLARDFGSAFGAGELTSLAGLWHDLGKYSDAFQDYLAQSHDPDPHVADATRVDHSTAGAQHAVEAIDIVGHLLAYAIAGHHSGLLDAISGGACLDARLKKTVEPWNRAPGEIINKPEPEFPPFVRAALGEKDGFSLAFFTRMLFSCLVDADFLDTEAFMRPKQATLRPSWPGDVLERMEGALDDHVAKLEAPSKSVGRQDGREKVGEARAAVRQACLVAAERPPGFFSLTVPTGGGKTLSSLAFALRHAGLHNLQRILYVIPFTSIIEQNAQQFRTVMAEGAGLQDCVIEHHSNVDVGEETTLSRLATENWDAPLIVTTSVQFYESLFANRTSRCRKLHRLAGSVIVLDEVQTLPVDFLEPCLNALRELAANYGATIVLCTATQPAVQQRVGFPIGLTRVHEIIADPPKLYEALKRVAVTQLGPVPDEALGERLLSHERVLCIVNTRRHARRVFEAIGTAPEHYHLSALMCPAHRTAVFDEIRVTLAAGSSPCRVISTQLIEAGVDIDFPTVYRSLAGLDSIAQAAGRCNREGELPVGSTYVFSSEHMASERFIAETANCGRQVLELYDDPLSLEAVEHFFRLYYWDQSDRWDAKDIVGHFTLDSSNRDLPFLFSFNRVARDFRLIEEHGQPIIVPWGSEGEQLSVDLLARGDKPDRNLLRRLQRYTVQVPQRIWNQLDHAIELVHGRYPVLTDTDAYYSERTGLAVERESLEFLGI